MEFEPRPDEVRAARYFAARTALEWGIDSRDLETVVGELAANAFQHARTPFSVSLSYLDAVVSIEVADHSPLPPLVHSSESTHTLASGRGLMMVEALVLDWGARATPGGKVVWAELPTVCTDGPRRRRTRAPRPARSTAKGKARRAR